MTMSIGAMGSAVPTPRGVLRVPWRCNEVPSRAGRGAGRGAGPPGPLNCTAKTGPGVDWISDDLRLFQHEVMKHHYFANR